MQYEIVKYSAELKPQVLRLQRGLWGPLDRQNAEFFEWKYERNPYIDRPLIYLAMHDGRVIGMRGLMGTKWRLGPSPAGTVLPCCADTIVKPAHREHGVFGKLTRFMLDDLAGGDYPYVINLSAGSATHIQSLLMGWRCVGGFETMVRAASRPSPLDWFRGRILSRSRLGIVLRRTIFNPSRRYLSTSLGIGAKPFRNIDRKDRPVTSPTGGRLTINRTARPAAMAELAARCAGGRRIRHVRDEAYFAWRYSDPKSVFRFLYWEKRALEGFLVLESRRETLAPAWANIVDLEAANRTIRQELFDAALDYGASSKLALWTVSIPDTDKAMLRAAAFQLEDATNAAKRTGPGFLLRAIDRSNADAEATFMDLAVFDIGNWDLRMVDADYAHVGHPAATGASGFRAHPAAREVSSR